MPAVDRSQTLQFLAWILRRWKSGCYQR